MHKRQVLGIGVCLAVLGLLFAGPVATQEEEGTIGLVYFVRAKPGMEAQFEEGTKKHMEWHRQQNDTWTWGAWVTMTGENTGRYAFGSFGHHWADFDNPGVSEEEDEANLQATMAPYAESAVARYYAYLPQVSHPAPEGESFPLSVVLVFELRVGTEGKFINNITKVHKAIEKTNWPGYHEWYVLVNGGRQPMFVLVLPQESWADMAPQETSFEAMLEEAFGRQEAESILRAFNHIIKSETSSIVRDRPDLSYIPEATTE